MKTRITLTVQWDSDQDGPNHGQTPHEAIAELCNSEIFDAYVCARCGNSHEKRAYGPGYAKVCPDCGSSSDVCLSDEVKARIAGRTFMSQSARDAQRALINGVTIDESYLDYLEETAQRYHDYYTERGDMETADEMLTRTLSEALMGNDGD